MKIKHSFNLFIFITAIFLGSCTIKNVPVAQKNSIQLPNKFEIGGDSVIIDSLRYERFFKDTVLINLINVAVQNNYDLKIAMQRVHIADAAILARSGRLVPEVFAGAQAGATRFGNYTIDGVGNYDTNFSENIDDNQKIPYPVTPDFNFGLSSTWEIDIWNKLRTQKKGAYFSYLATDQGRKLIITQLVSRVANLYFDLLERDNELKIVQNNIELQEKALELVEIQKLAGRVTELAVKQFNAQLLNSRSLEFAIHQEIVEIENALNLLLGRTPQNIERGVGILEQELPDINKTGIPSDLLLNRPDLKQLEYELEASQANIYAARAAFYPSLRLNAFLGMEAFKPHLVFNPESVAFNAMAGITAPIFNRRGLKANFKRVQAENYTLLYQYEQATLNAFSEVVTSLKGIDNSTRLYELKALQVEELRKAVSTSNDLFLGGYANYLEVVTAQKNVFEAELELMQSRKNQFKYLIELYRSLGGGWPE
ncbi:TolC family protein [Flexithrix dorotheae]|uniref:TolC family protein n=1 Tax=Flexithrix dorotheae TaxID=70993 RepID=UPI0012F7AF64|nr:TolC family protein [Flexithrix dorotheae]